MIFWGVSGVDGPLLTVPQRVCYYWTKVRLMLFGLKAKYSYMTKLKLNMNMAAVLMMALLQQYFRNH